MSENLYQLASTILRDLGLKPAVIRSLPLGVLHSIGNEAAPVVAEKGYPAALENARQRLASAVARRAQSLI